MVSCCLLFLMRELQENSHSHYVCLNQSSIWGRGAIISPSSIRQHPHRHSRSITLYKHTYGEHTQRKRFLSYRWHRMVFLQSAVVLAIPCSDSSIQQPRCEWCTPDQTQQSSQTPAKQKYTQTPFMTSGAPLNIWKLIKAISPKKMLIVIFCKVRHECITYVYTLKTLHTHPDTPQEA